MLPSPARPPARVWRATRMALAIVLGAYAVAQGIVRLPAFDRWARERVAGELRARVGEATVAPGVAVDPLFRAAFGPVTIPGARAGEPLARIERVDVRPSLLRPPGRPPRGGLDPADRGAHCRGHARARAPRAPGSPRAPWTGRLRGASRGRAARPPRRARVVPGDPHPRPRGGAPRRRTHGGARPRRRRGHRLARRRRDVARDDAAAPRRRRGRDHGPGCRRSLARSPPARAARPGAPAAIVARRPRDARGRHRRARAGRRGGRRSRARRGEAARDRRAAVRLGRPHRGRAARPLPGRRGGHRHLGRDGAAGRVPRRRRVARGGAARGDGGGGPARLRGALQRDVSRGRRRLGGARGGAPARARSAP